MGAVYNNIFNSPDAPFRVSDYTQTHLPSGKFFVPHTFKHTRPDGKPTPPDKSALDEDELAEVEAWEDGLVEPTLAAAITYKTNYLTYKAQYAAWKLADYWARIMQFRNAGADAQSYNRATSAVSATPTGTGDTPPSGNVYPRLDP